MPQRRLVEVFEQERYYPLAGWSKKLLATDRDNYSSREGDWGCSTLEEYSDAVISTGWFWEQGGWQRSETDTNVDEDGWAYAVDFSVFTHSATTEAAEALGGIRRGSVVFASDGNMSAADQSLLMEMAAANKAAEMAGNFHDSDGAASDSEGEGDETTAITAASEILNTVNENDNSVDVSYESLGERVKSMLHFVRRRRLLRWQCYDPSVYTGVPISCLPCSHCDLTALNELTILLLTSLAEASVIAHPRAFNEAKCNSLKSRLVQALDLNCSKVEHLKNILNDTSNETKPESSEGVAIDAKRPLKGSTADDVGGVDAAAKMTTSPTAPNSESELKVSSMSNALERPQNEGSSDGSRRKSGSVVAYSMTTLVKQLLEPFMGSLVSAGSTLSSLLSSETNNQIIGRRTADIARSFFPTTERRLIAEAIIRRHDIPGNATSPRKLDPSNTDAPRFGTGYLYHCNVVQCDSSCVFAHETCPNRKCEVEYSSRDHERHQSECQYASVECPRGCDDAGVLRKDLSLHMQHSCPFRSAGCPFKDLGCMQSLTAVQLPDHMDTCTNAHLMLLLNRVVEQQQVIKSLHKQANEAKAQTARYAALLGTATAEIESLRALTNGQEFRDEIIKLQRNMTQIDSNVTAKLSRVQKQIMDTQEVEKRRVNTEFAKFNKHLLSK